jgi:hypothetical protein
MPVTATALAYRVPSEPFEAGLDGSVSKVANQKCSSGMVNPFKLCDDGAPVIGHAASETTHIVPCALQNRIVGRSVVRKAHGTGIDDADLPSKSVAGSMRVTHEYPAPPRSLQVLC